jgi:hypothetical protein
MMTGVTPWAATRREQGAREVDPFVCSVQLFRSAAAAAQTIVDFDRMGMELVAIAEALCHD